MALHDRILERLNRSYASPTHDLPFPNAWWADPAIAALRRDLVAFLEQRMGRSCFGFKDPRTIRLMPLWQQIARELDLVPKIVFCLRNPAQVARSLHERDGLSPETAEFRWFSYVADFFRYVRAGDACILEYEDWFAIFR